MAERRRLRATPRPEPAWLRDLTEIVTALLTIAVASLGLVFCVAIGVAMAAQVGVPPTEVAAWLARTFGWPYGAGDDPWPVIGAGLGRIVLWVVASASGGWFGNWLFRRHRQKQAAAAAGEDRDV